MKKITLMLFALVAFCWQSNAQLTEGFDTAGLPADWTETELSGANANWASGAANNQNSSVQPRTGAGMAYFYEPSYEGETTRLETPSQDLTSLTTPLLTFYYTQVDWGGDQDELSIWYKDGAAGTWTMLQEFTGSVSSWTEVNIILPSPSADYYIGFQGYSGYGRGVTVDDVSIGEAPSCLAPGSLDVSITSTSTATLNWSASGSETDFTYEYGAAGYVQGTGQLGGMAILGMSSADITGLIPGTDYEFYVQANCGVDGDSGFSGPFAWTQPDEGESCGTAIMSTLEADCGTATPISLDFTGAPSNISTSCDTFNNYGLWITAMTDAAGGLTVNASAAVDMAIFDACGGTDVACYEGGISPSVNVALSPNTQYYLYFWQEGTTSTAMVDVCISSYTLAVAPECAEAPTVPNDAATGVMLPGGIVNLSWTAPSSGAAPTDYEVFFGDTSGALASIGLLGSTDTNVDITGLDFSTTYYWSILPYNDITAATNTCAEWSFTTDAPPTGYDCNDPILVGALPYNTTDDTGGYGDVYAGSPGATGCGTTSNYLNGDDVVYAYTATADGTIKLAMSGIGSTYSGIFVYTDCANIGTECVAGFGNGGSTDDYNIDVAVTNGTTYYIVLSTWAAPQNTAYTLDITEVLCAEPSDLAAATTGLDTVDITWTAGDVETEWTYEYGVSPYAQGGGGTSGTVMTTPSLSLSSLTPGETYDIYVQANCTGGDNSPYVTTSWTQPVVGATCETAIDVAALPFNTSDDTANYGDNYSAAPGDATSCGTDNAYLNGDDVVYAYTATANGVINIAMSGIGSTYSGIFVYTDCANIGTECVAGFGNGFSTDDYNLDVTVTDATTYYIVISTWAAPQSTTFTLDITEGGCDAEAGTLTADATPVDLVGGTATISATPNGDIVVPTDYEVTYVLTSGAGLVIEQAGATPSFDVTMAGDYTIHTLVAETSDDMDPNYLDLSVIVFGTTTGGDVLGIVSANNLCASLDVTGAPITVNAAVEVLDFYNAQYVEETGSNPSVGSNTSLTIEEGTSVTVYAQAYELGLTDMAGQGAGIECWIAINDQDTDPSTWDMASWQVATYLGDSGNNDEYSIDTATVPVGTNYIAARWRLNNSDFTYGGYNGAWDGTNNVNIELVVTEACTANAGSLTADATPVTLSGGSATISATANGDIVVPTDYEVTYVLTSGQSLVIEQAGASPSFDVTMSGDYTIHTLVAETSDDMDPNYLDLSVIVFGTTTGGDVLGIVSANNLCAALDVSGAPILVQDECLADAGTLTADVSPVELTGGTATISATANGDIVVPTDYEVIYVLTSGASLVIEQAGATPSFDVTSVGDYTIHTLVAETSDDMDPNYLDLSVIVFGTTTGGDVLSIVSANNLCASLDVTGAPIVVEDLLSIGEVENETAFTYYPNPVKNTLTLNAQNTIEQVAMYNMLGQEVLRATPNTVDSDIDMSNLQKGPYFVKVTIANVTQTVRVIKQ